MYRLPIIFLALIYSTSFFGQITEFAWNQPKKGKEDFAFAGFLGDDGDNIYAYEGTVRQRRFDVLVFDTLLNEKNRLVVDMDVKRSDFNQPPLLLTPKAIVCFYVEIANLSKTKTLKYKLVKVPELRAAEDVETIMEFKSKSGSFSQSFYTGNNFIIRQSQDKSKIAVLISTVTDKNEREIVAIKVYDAEMKQLWEREVNLSYLHDEYRLINSAISNDGSVQMIGSVYTSDANEFQPEAGARLSITFVDANSDIDPQVINPEVGFIDQVKTTINNQGQLMVGGFYSNNKRSWVAGTIMCVYDPQSNTILNAQKFKYSMDFTDAFALKSSEGEDPSDKNEIRFLKVDEMETFDSEFLYIIGEQKIIANFLSIIVNKFDSQGNFLWANAIPKHQLAKGTASASSYAVVENDQTLCFIYSESEKNFDDKSKKYYERVLSSNAKVACAVAILTPEGSLSRDIIPNREGDPDRYEVNDFYRMSGNELITIGIENGKYMSGTFRLN